MYLAMHPRGVAEHQLDEAIWPERHMVKATTRDPVVSQPAPPSVGPSACATPRGRARTSATGSPSQVGTDWERFCLSTPPAAPPSRDDPLLCGTRSSLVRGRPFADVVAGPGYAWLHLEGHLHHMEAEIVDAADLAAELLLEDGDPVSRPVGSQPGPPRPARTPSASGSGSWLWPTPSARPSRSSASLPRWTAGWISRATTTSCTPTRSTPTGGTPVAPGAPSSRAAERRLLRRAQNARTSGSKCSSGSLR